MKNLYLLLLFLIFAPSLMFGGEFSYEEILNTKLNNSPPPNFVNSYFWGEHEVTTEKYPISPILGIDFFGDTSLTFKNNGTQDINIDYVRVKVIIGNPNSFILNGFKLEVKDILSKYGRLTLKPGQSFVEQVYFSPKSEGLHEIEVTFENDANIPNTCTLSGIGIKSAASVEEKYDNLFTIANHNNSIQILKNKDANFTYKLISLTGSNIASGSLETSTEISLSNFPKQMFFLEIANSKNEVVLRKKIIVE